MKFVKLFFLVIAGFGPFFLQAADLRLADIFGDHMILQREMPVPVWGWTSSDTAVTVRFSGQEKSTQSNGEGYWKVLLDQLTANAEGLPLQVRSGEESLELKDVKVGELWLAAGQSNMVQEEPDLDSGIYPFHQPSKDPAALPEIRIWRVGDGASLTPIPDTDPLFRGQQSWEELKEPLQGNKGMYAYFARVLRDELDLPIGIIHVAASGTNQTAWMARETLESFPGSEGYKTYYEEAYAAKEARLAESNSPFDSWAEFVEADKNWRANPPKRGRWPGSDRFLRNYPTVLYNTRIYPLAPMAFRGVIWHQGEGGPGENYGPRMAAKFSQWRKIFGNDFPAIVGTLTRNTAIAQPPLIPLTGSFYRSVTNEQIRLAPTFNQDEALLEVVEFYDVGNQFTHFGMKNECGRRMGRAALDQVYGIPSVYTGPRFVSAEIVDGGIRATFDPMGKGLVVDPSFEGISGFYLQGASGKAVWAEVKVLDEKTLLFSHPELSAPKILAYGRFPNPHETLFNATGLPASPFLFNPEDIKLLRESSPDLIALKNPSKRTVLHLAHVRREGYILEVVNHRLKTLETAVVQAALSSEWEEVEVVREGQKVTYTSLPDADGRRQIQFEVPVNGPRTVVAAPGQAGDLEKVHRF